jgi:solute carrier family 45 protein 1/2/4
MLSLGWFPILFFTSIWVSEIYKASYTGPETNRATIEADGVRAGARALLFQALVNIACSIGLPLLVSESGVQAASSGGKYESLNVNGTSSQEMDDRWKPMNLVQDLRSGGIVMKAKMWVGGLISSVRDGSAWVLPIQGFTLIKLWYISQFTFAAAMAMTW